MIRVNGFPVYQLGTNIGLLKTFLYAPDDCTIATMDFALVQAFGSLDFLANQSILLEPSKAAARGLIERLRQLFNEPDKSRVVLMQERAQLLFEIIQFETTLANDLNQLDLYWVEPKLGYSTSVLLTEGDKVFPDSIRDAIPQKVRGDMVEAARCLAFDLPTAVGFHVLRAVELVV